MSLVILRTGESWELTVVVGSFLFMARPPPLRSCMRRLGMTFRTIRSRTLFLVDRGVINKYDLAQRIGPGEVRNWAMSWRAAKVK